ncbi:MG2 domain-containing protein [Flavobacterium sp. N2820]|uniref:alpha-2-macroglobulin family protein n=1 Tax=Flavobacterium sp. N2820 TaxID=2986834 RepID=UPI002225723C|nr:alpha-2-macroglobulin family protein [Flavobacterium sp. N2820]
MRKILFLLLFVSSFSSFSQYDDKWKEVYNYELDGKIKSAEEKVQEIYKKAKRKKDEVQIVKCFFYLSKFEQIFNEKAQTTIIVNLQDEIRTVQPVSKALLNYIYATVLEKYYQRFSYQISKLTPVKNQKSKDFLIWSSSDFEKEIEKTYALCLKDEEILRNTFLNSYKDIFEISHAVDAKNFSIYDFISQKCIAYNKTKLNNKYSNKALDYPKDITPFYEETEVFLFQNFDTINEKELKNLVKILQKNEKYYSANQDKIDEKYYERLKIFNGIFIDYTLFLSKINALEKKTNNLFLKQYLRLDRVKHYQSRSFKNDDKNLNEKALKLIDTILETKVNLDALATAENIKIEIHKKSIYLQLPKITYSNQNNRAYVRFKNIDTITISYYPLPHKLNHLFEENYYRNNIFYKDSIVKDLVSKNKVIKKQIVKLPNKNDYYETSTEFLLDKLEVGNYLVYVETSNQSNLDKNAFAYQRLQVTDLFVFEDDEKNKDVFYTYNRKTGKPIENIKFKNEVESSISNSNGKASLNPTKYEKDVTYSHNVEITHQKDTILKTYNRNFIYSNDFEDDEDENFEAKAMVYFDRAIYRPGQKMYYKGIIIQNLNDEKSVVPFVSVHVTIEDENNSVLKEFDVQTNEFGSFSGEFDIPKNVLTGEFSIEIDEAENYEIDKKYYDKDEDEHKFWDNVDFNSYESFRFKVEEYKRPTFEVKFDEIKENYTIGDTLKIKGNAKALAGNNLSNAKVAYSITKHISSNKYVPYQKNYINKEITTDENGNFLIQFTATDSILSNEEINALNFSIEATVTDTNGETRTAYQEVIVGKEMLELNLKFKNYLVVEENNILKINATTLNNYPIDTKGTLKVYEIQQKKYLKNRLFYYPEIRAFTREEFERLFPHEAYDESDYETKDVLIKTISFDTKNSKEINLDFLRNYKTSKFKIITEAYDAKNNLIKIENELNVKSKKEPFLNEKLFVFKDISDEKSNFHTIEIQSIIPDLYVTSRFYIDGKSANNVQTTQLNNGKAIFKFPKTNDYKDKLTFYFTSVWENLMHQEYHTIKQETTENKLNIEIESYRNKIEPGSVENWSFKILNQKLESEVLASMYDQSLDQFVTDGWKNILFNDKNYYTITPTTENEYPYTSVQLNNFIDLKKRYFNVRTNTDLNWFGFDFTNPKNEYVINNYYNNIKTKTRIPKDAKFIIGIVSDDLGPIAGANVSVHGTDRGTVTNFDGEFEIEAAKGETLLVSYAGSSEMVLVDNRKDYTITLKAVEIHEVTVMGVLGIRRKVDAVTSSNQVVNNAELTQSGNQNVLQTLAGKVSGLQINTTNNGVNSTTRIVLRGNRSISEKNEALVVIDGVISNANILQSMQAELIQDVQILKGMQGAALYGEQGRNGVIIVTTKNALKELTQVKTRTNFNETAFFYPNLKTDNNGKVSFNFTTPESLTQWKLRLYAHNKKAETGYFESSVISQKDVMIQTNMPRFVRENDTINISAKVINMTNETKSGIAMLLLYDASTMKIIDSIALNFNNTRNFSCKPKESVPVNWKITIPEGVQGLQYKIVAKSGNFSDGEENILPVLSNKILITESIPIWVKGNSKKEYAFENLKNNNSKTLKNHLFTLEYTSNPVWFALQSLPYLMEYEHECAEQTFSRYYANFIATEIINSNPKVASLFDSWKNNPKAVSKLTQNDELKSIVLNETPWLLDAENDDLKNKRLALLMDLNTMKESQEKTLKKLEEKQKSSGGFAWFDGGNENNYITQHIVAGLGHLEKMFPQDSSKFDGIITKAIPYLDANFIKTNTSKNERLSYFYYSNLHFLYARSFHLDKMPISKKMDSIINIQKKEYKTNWLNYSLYKKGLLALTMYRFGDAAFAQKIISNLKETAARNDEYGMYWIENKNGYYWYQSPIETQALLIEAFAEIEKDKKYVDEMKVWLLKNKQVNRWSTTKATSEAIYALLLQGTDWTSIKDNTKFKIGNEKVLTKKLSEKDKEATTGYVKMNWSAAEISKEMGTISVENKTEVPGYGSVYWQYFENLENVKSDSTKVLSITKNAYKKTKTTSGNELVELSKENLKPGDLVTIQLIIKTENDLEFVHLKDLRASCFEPVDVISEYKWKNGLGYYQSTKDIATHFFFDTIKTGTYVLEYDVRINNSGSFNDGIATLQSMYAPEFTGHSTSTKLKIQD